MNEHIGMTCLYKYGEFKNFRPEEVEAAEKEGWKDTPQPVTQAVSKPAVNKLDPKRP